METLTGYVIKSGSILLLFSLLYYVLLRKETFFKTNRFFLLGGLLASIVLPLLTFTKTILIDPVPVKEFSEAAHPVLMQTGVIPVENTLTIDWFSLLGIVYLPGVLFFIGQFVFDYYALRKVLSGKTIRNVGSYKIIETSEDLTPFSWFRYIVYNPSLYETSELENILEHEKTHCRQWHSADVIFSRLFCIVFWFNPIAWLHKSMMIQNLEFIADSEASEKIASKKDYQITLLKVTAHENCLAFTNHFYQSLIKKRIVMLNKKASKKRSLWKYGIVLPALVTFMLQFQVNVVAQEKPAISNKTVTSERIDEDITAKTTKAELIKGLVPLFQEEYSIKIEFPILAIKKDKISAISVKMTDANGNVKMYADDGPDEISPFRVFVEKWEDGSRNFGFSAGNENPALRDHFNVVNANDKKVTTAEPVKEASLSVNDGYSVDFKTSDKKDKPAADENVSFGYFKTSQAEDVISDISEDKTVDPKKALIKINGKESTYEELIKIDPKLVASKSVMAASSTSEEGRAAIIKAFGEKAQYGTIEIELKGFKPEPAHVEKIDDGKPLLDYENGGFIIHKKSGKEDFKFYKTELRKIDIKLEISQIERNSKGEITAIRVQLTDLKNGTGGMTFRNTPTNKQGIPEINIGRKNGKLFLSSDN